MNDAERHEELRHVLETADCLHDAAAVQAAIDLAQQLLHDALALLDALLWQVSTELEALRGGILAVLDDTPLVSLDALSVVTRTTVTSASAG
ncbi:MAG: hypothetical protein KY410_09005, partial [Proteobacteria bacterium]|nr:hypothetical protein [Pseudomonadota bacterium]